METAPTTSEFARWHRLSVRQRGELARAVVQAVSEAVQPFSAAAPTEAVLAQLEDAAVEAIQGMHRRFRELPPVEVSVQRGQSGTVLVGLSQWLIDAASQGGEPRRRG